MAPVPRSPIVLHGPVVVLCEGQHDAAFLHAIARRIDRSDRIDPAFFEKRDGRWQRREGRSYGGPAIAQHLREIGVLMRASPDDAARVSGILLLRDCGEDANGVLRETEAACGAAGFVAPQTAGVWSDAASAPRIALMLLPAAGGRGSLESLCLDYLRTQHAAAAACMDTYFACIGTAAKQPTAENRAKAMLASLIAAIVPANPTQTLSGAFSGTHPLIDVTAPLFTPFADALAALLTPPAATA
jgi:hypothetical protein